MSVESQPVHRGGCLCGAVRYELRAPVAPLVNCHCRFCRRAHGAAFVTTVAVPSGRLRFTSGEDAIARHEGRFFCGTCATRLFNRAEAFPDLTMLMAASLDEPPDDEPAAHYNVESMAPWHRIRDDAPRFDGFPPAIEAMMEGAKGD